MEEKLKSDEARFIKDMEQQEQQHEKRIQDMEDANIRSQNLIKSELSDLRKSSDRKFKELHTQLSNERNKYNREKREAMKTIAELKQSM